MPASIASWRCWAMSAVKIGVSAQQADDDPGVAGGDRPAAVDRLRGAAAERGLGQRREHQREADADQDLRRQRSAPPSAFGSSARPPRPPATRIAPAAARARALGTSGPRRLPRMRGQRHHGDHDRGPDRGQAPALDQQQDQQEERRGDRRRDHRQGQVGPEVRAAGAAQLGLRGSRSPPRAWRRRGSAPRRPAPPAPGAGRSTARRPAR